MYQNSLRTTTRTLLPEILHIESLLSPETTAESHLLTLPQFREGLEWGEPRFGHPEGKVAYHVRDVLDNIDRMKAYLSDDDRQRLRLVAFAHDTFKYQEAEMRRNGAKNDWWLSHHGYLARKFMENHTSDAVVLDLIEWHDEAYFCWRTKFLYDDPEGAQIRLRRLLPKINDKMDLYYIFFKCDTFTGDKIHAPVKWFETTVLGDSILQQVVNATLN